MGSKLYVGNLSYNTTGSDLEQLFGQHGTVQSAEVISDRDTGRSKGSAVVPAMPPTRKMPSMLFN